MAELCRAADKKYDATAKEIFSEVFMPNDTIDATCDVPCDVVLVVKDGKEFKAHRQVLSDASPFFEKLLNSDMKESKEGIVRLEMFSESVVENALEFIYTGNVQILTEDSARDLIVIADYLFLENLKTLAEGVLQQMLNTSNCISIYYFSERYQCRELFSKNTKFIHANFSAVCAASREEILNMSSKQVQMWISSDEINVTAEDDVFKIILAWIYHDKSKRKKYFPELFRHVRLLYVSRDFLCRDVVTNDYVKDNEGCLGLVEEAIRLIESRNYDNLPVIPRKCLEVPVIVACSPLNGQHIHCYFPREDRWYSLGEMPYPFEGSYLVSCHGKIYGIQTALPYHRYRIRIASSFNPYTNNWISLPCKEDRDIKQIFVAKEDEMYAFVSEPCDYHRRIRSLGPLDTETEFCDKEKHISFITKYKPESNSWEDISSFDHMNLRENVCIVVKDNFIYFIGGHERGRTGYNDLTNVDRYDLCKNQWDKVADIQIARRCATGAAANGKIFIAGGANLTGCCPKECQCEVFIETTNEWQFIPTFGIHPKSRPKLLSVDDRLYVLARWEHIYSIGKSAQYQRNVKCYDPDKKEWNQKTKLPANMRFAFIYCSMRIFKGFLDNEEEKKDTRETASLSAQSSRDLSSLRLSSRSLSSLRLQAENTTQAEMTSPSAQSSRDLSSLRLQAENTKQAEMTSPAAHSLRDVSSLRLQSENTRQAEMTSPSAQSSRDLSSLRLQAENTNQASLKVQRQRKCCKCLIL